MLEKEIEAKVCAYAKSKGFLHFKFSSPGHWGVPDRIFFGDMGTVFLIEFKREGEKPTPVQLREAARFKVLRHHVYLVDSVEFGMEVINREADRCDFAVQMFALARAMETGEDSGETRH